MNLLNPITMKPEPGTGETSVAVRDLSVAFGPLTILANLSIDVHQGEFLVLLGPSGCGKSTLLNTIAGLLDAKSGEIWISGRDVTDLEPKDRGIGMVFQSYALYPRMTVAQNMGFGLKIAGTPKAEVAERVKRAAETLQLEPLISRYPAELSGGQRQRVAIGRALVRNVDVFLFDEPLSNLDAQLRASLRVEIKRLHASLGNTMIYVTHDQIEAMTLADRIAVMKDGIIQQIGAPKDVYDRPCNRFVAGFVGSPAMSFLDGRMKTEGDAAALDLGGTTISLRGYQFSRTVTSASVVLGVRPEHVTAIAFGEPQTPGVWFAGQVMMIEPTGADTIVWSEVGGQQLAIRVSGDRSFTVSEPIWFALDIARASLFDATDGSRL